MCTSLSSPSQTPITTLDESHTHSVKSSPQTLQHTTRPQPNSPPSPIHTAPPPVSSPRLDAISTSTSTSAVQSRVQPSPPSQNMSANSISVDSNSSCLILPEHTSPLRHDQPVKVSSQPRNSGIVEPIPLSSNHRQAITPSFSFPGASNPTTTYDSIYPSSPDPHFTITATSSTESISGHSPQTPNVYINGLPAYFSEQQLFALARHFGDIKSVRTFTRHVSEKPTGYGFVLFNDVESAQRCIEGLRKYRNLHPSFSKQVHRIPGTEYAKHNAVQSTDQDENSFKSRMEKLKDTSSTNLYIEGLPLSIDEESLAALMQPYKIKSSRFFKTKLSDPPRIIAFVRLETRDAAEDTIERLHGRLVRGWNDPGCRISVRFADSTEQRELRRTERTLKNGDQSPSRLTIAQAALLNLRGQELQANIRDVAACKTQRLAKARSDNRAAFDPGCDSALLPTSLSLPSKLCYTYRESPLLATSDLPSASEMDTLLQSIQNGYEDGSLDSTMRNLTLDNEYFIAQKAQLRAFAGAALMAPNPLPIAMPRGHAQARNGFTPAEELILEAHAQHLQLQTQLSKSSPTFDPISRRPNPNVRSFDPHEPFRPSGLVAKGMHYQDTLPTISEDEFHAMNHPTRNFAPISQSLTQGLMDSFPPDVPTTTIATFMRPPSRAVSIIPPPPDYEEPGKRPKGHQHSEGLVGSKQTPVNHRHPTASGESKSRPSLLQTSLYPNSTPRNGIGNNTSTLSGDKTIESRHTYMYSHGDVRGSSDEDMGTRFRSAAPHIYAKNTSQLGEKHSMVKEELKSPAVVSPALTYSSRTPSTLSPATPFFGSFTGSSAFEAMGIENEDMAERKLKARVAKG